MVDRQVSEPQAGTQTDHHAAAFEAFVEYTQVAGATSEVRELAQKAIKVLEARVGGGAALYGEPDGNLWKARAWNEHFSPGGLALVTSDDWAPPLVTEVLRARDIVFRETFERASGPLGAYGAVAACPVLLGGEVRGLLVLLLPDASSWRGHTRAVMQAVGRGLSLALERAEVTRQLDEERNALATFAAFTEAVSSATDIPTLVQLAFSVLPRRFPQAVVGYYEPAGEVWKLRAYTGSVSSDLIGVATGGKVPVHPDALSAIRNNEVTFVDNWGTRFESLLGNHHFGKVAFYPLAVGGEVRAGLVFGVQTLRVWGERDKALVRAIGRSFNLAFERTTTAAALKEQQAELEARTRAMDAFVNLTRDMTLQSDPHTLIRRAQEVVMSLLPDGYALYSEPENGRWMARVQHGEMHSPQMQALVDQGIPFEDTRHLVHPWSTRTPVYQSAFELGGEELNPELREQIGSTATVPVLVHDVPVGLLIVVLFERRAWTNIDRATLEAVVYSLGLALERARGVAQLSEEQAKLQVANEELEAFAYSVSHDLRTPVRHILGFNNLLRKALGDDLGPQPARYLQVVGDAATRMNTLIDALLDLSRASRTPLQLTQVDLSALLAEVLNEFELDHPPQPVTWTISPLPTVMGDQDTLRQVLGNLISNALKYSRTNPRPTIEVWAEERPDEWAILVRDNGVGFDPRYAHKLFGVFQRLHSPEEYEGTGVGLANVRRIVLRHGGQVTAIGAPGEGATFSFTLPRRG